MPHSPEGHRKAFAGSGSPGSCLYFCNSVSTHCRLNCNILQLTDPDPSSAQCQDQEVQTDLFFPPGCLQKAPIFLPPQLLSLVTKSLVLQLEQLDAAFPCPDKFQKLIHCSQHGICAAHRVPLSQPILYPMICSFRKEPFPF